MTEEINGYLTKCPYCKMTAWEGNKKNQGCLACGKSNNTLYELDDFIDWLIERLDVNVETEGWFEPTLVVLLKMREKDAQKTIEQYYNLKIQIQELKCRLDHATNYDSYSAATCPLCVYRNGKFIESCSYHNEIFNLKADREQLQSYVNEIEQRYLQRLELDVSDDSENHVVIDMKKLEEDLLKSQGVINTRDLPSSEQIIKRNRLHEFVKLTNKYIVKK